MAKKRALARRAKMQPAELTLKYQLPGNGTDVYIDLMRDLSAVNRRGYNAGQVLHITGFSIKQDSAAANTTGLESTIKALPMTWVAAQAYMKARMAWMDQQNRVRREAGQDSIRPAYEDFKVFMDNGQRAWAAAEVAAGRLTVGEYSQPTLTGDSAVAVVQGEWDPSRLVYADQTSDPETIKQPFLHMVGPDVGDADIGLINAYEDSRATVSATQPNVPAAASSNIYALMTIGQDDGAAKEVIENMEDDNDNPPYALNNYPGGAVNYPNNVDKCYVQTNPSNPVVQAPGFHCMLGLIRVYSQGKTLATGADTTLTGTLLVHLAPGPKRGVLSMNVGDLV
jgi:hypothetical protein